MSSNNQVLIKKHNSKWYVFKDIMAESWCDRNCILAQRADVFNTEDKAYAAAIEFAKNTEYGISDRLVKDEAEVTIIED